jgi:hypothetical protein
LSKLPRRRLARALQRYHELHPDDALTLQAAPIALVQDNFVFAQKFASHWKAAWEVVDSDEAFKSVTNQLVDLMCGLLGFTRVDERTYRGLIGSVVRAPALRLKIPARFPIIFLPRHQVHAGDVEALRDLMNILGMVSYFALIIDLRDSPPTDSRQSLKTLVREAIHDFIVLDGKDIRYLLAATLQSVIAQRLIPLKEGKGRTPAVEVMIVTSTIREYIIDPEKTPLITQAIREGVSSHGMQSFDQHLLAMYQAEQISGTEALRWATNPEGLSVAMRGIKRIGGIA